MGYPHVKNAKKVEAIAYHLVGLRQVDAAKRAGVVPTSLCNWMKKYPDLVTEARKLVERAKREAIIDAKLARGELIRAGQKLFTPEGYQRLVESGKTHGPKGGRKSSPKTAKIKTKKPIQSVLGVPLARGARIEGDNVITRSGRHFTFDSYRRIVENSQRNGRKNAHILQSISAEQRRENAKLAVISREVRKIDEREGNGG